ncbi:tape measure protein, partial [Paludibacteraceae bacterium OttesenSCG-928-F17]|nr:tape measure protein [Paludibacteraceae bacterium OttesenSCG-928-F17]
MSNIFTYVLNLRDQMTGTLRRVGGSLADTTKQTAGLRREVERLNNLPIKIGEKLRQSFRNIPFAQYIFNPLTIAGVVGGRALKLGIDEEMRGASFEVLFGGEENARKVIDNIDAYAKKTTYGKENLSAAVQTMAGFGIAQERIMPNLKAIGEIVMGDKGKLSSLTLAFSQMSATGQLMGQDLNQMINAGFNPLLQMSKDTGKSVGQLKEEMGKGKISADMVAQAFQNATKEGGQFYGMSEKMSKTFGGQLQLAMANINDKLIKLYGIIQPYLLPAVRAFNLMLTDTSTFIDKVVGKVENWINQNKVLSSIIITVAAAIAGYRLALIGLAGAHLLVVGMKKILAAYQIVVFAVKNATSLWTAATWLLNVALGANPIGLIIAGVVALIALIT